MQGLIGPLKELAEFEELCKNKKKDQLLFYMVFLNLLYAHCHIFILLFTHCFTPPRRILGSRNRYDRSVSRFTTT